MRPASAQDIAQLSDLMFVAVHHDRWTVAVGKLEQAMSPSRAAIGLLDTRTYENTGLCGNCEAQYGRPVGPMADARRYGLPSPRLQAPLGDAFEQLPLRQINREGRV